MSVTVFLFIIPLLLCGGVAAVNDGEFGGGYSGIIIPGFASTKLHSRSIFDDCAESSLDFDPLDLMVKKFSHTRSLSAADCWIECMSLGYNQTDHPHCKSRPVTGLSGITELDPGFITGPSSNVWEEWLRWCHEFGIEAVAAPYDWRLSPTQLEERDLYFHNLKLTFETARKLRGRPSIVFAHSLGNNVFRYFLKWLTAEVAPKYYLKWVDQHIHAYFALGAPFLGSVDILKSTLFGEQPIYKEYWLTEHWLTNQNTYADFLFSVLRLQGSSRSLFNSFPSSLWMLPFSNCKIEDKHQGWPTNIINIEIPFENATTCPLLVQRYFTACEIANGNFFKAIEHCDPYIKKVLQHLERLYHDDPVLNPLTHWERPPIKNVFCIYGVNSKTEVGYHVAPNDKDYPNNWIVKDVIYETGDTLTSRSRNLVDGHPGPITGDGKVPYNSLSWCKTWLGPKVNITTAPQAAEYNRSDIKMELNVDIVPTKGSNGKYISFYEDSESLPGKKTAVWEIDEEKHWNLVKSKVLMRELSLQLWNDVGSAPKEKFVTKAKRRPLRDADCFWDYAKSECGPKDYCIQRYEIGSELEEVCKLRTHLLKCLWEYV